MIFYSIKVKGLGGWLHELLGSPFGIRPLLGSAAARSLSTCSSTLIEYISKPLSHSLRLFGNMYAGEIMFLAHRAAVRLAASSAQLAAAVARQACGDSSTISSSLLQAYIFMMLTIAYICDGARTSLRQSQPFNLRSERKTAMDKLQLVAQIQAFTGIGIGLMIGLGALGACVSASASCARASSRARAPAGNDSGAAGEGVPAARSDRRVVHHRSGHRDALRVTANPLIPPGLK